MDGLVCETSTFKKNCLFHENALIQKSLCQNKTKSYVKVKERALSPFYVTKDASDCTIVSVRSKINVTCAEHSYTVDFAPRFGNKTSIRATRRNDMGTPILTFVV